MLLYAVSRFVIEFFRADPRGMVLSVSTSQFISIVLAVLSQAAAIALVRISQSVIDLAIRPRDEQMLWELIALIAVIGIVKVMRLEAAIVFK